MEPKLFPLRKLKIRPLREAAKHDLGLHQFRDSFSDSSGRKALQSTTTFRNKESRNSGGETRPKF